MEGENDRPRENLLHKEKYLHSHGGHVRILQDGVLKMMGDDLTMVHAMKSPASSGSILSM